MKPAGFVLAATVAVFHACHAGNSNAEIVMMDFSDGEGVPGSVIDALPGSGQTADPTFGLAAASNVYEEEGFRITALSTGSVDVSSNFIYGQNGSGNHVDTSATSTGLSTVNVTSKDNLDGTFSGSGNTAIRFLLEQTDGSNFDFRSLQLSTFFDPGESTSSNQTVLFQALDTSDAVIGSLSFAFGSAGASFNSNAGPFTVDFTSTAGFDVANSIRWSQTHVGRHQFDNIVIDNLDAAAVPEPSSLFAMATMGGVVAWRKRRTKLAA
ncbi:MULTISPECIES: PEP-CTERM sorting domain-containing protein [Crateriforma]|uniref:Ice-binding protein C-terminal domain-containing protein n=1 Tax=Crateriforma conspicua TaxID=2527996 RepID=A0A5C6FN37_9PLAN|nr:MULTISPECIES: PEP-CTERM sorting domain-containing protein [Crateriforma]TWU60947.1 hypothetical protein V7x_52580 [Crateriforma conspicua]